MIELSNNRRAAGRAASALAAFGAAALLPFLVQPAHAAARPRQAAAPPLHAVGAASAVTNGALGAVAGGAPAAVATRVLPAGAAVPAVAGGAAPGLVGGAAPDVADAAPPAASGVLDAVSGPSPGVVERRQAVWDQLAQCESSGDWHVNSGNGFYGGLQFYQPTWEQYGGTRFAPRADLATPEEQVAVARNVQHAQGWQAWPSCSRRLGLAADGGSTTGTHTVRSGESLSRIAASHHVQGGWSALYRANKATVGPDPDNLAVGTILTIP